MAYDVAKTLLSEDMDPLMWLYLYKDLERREVAPEQWDDQVRFWSDLIKRWGRTTGIMQFNVQQLRNAWIFRNTQPPLHASLKMLVNTKVLKSRADYLSQSSLFSRILGFLCPSTPKEDSVYIFVNNVKERVRRVVEEIGSKATIAPDLCIPRQQLREEYPDIDVDIWVAELKQMKGVAEVFDSGYYVHAAGFAKLSRQTAKSVIDSKTALSKLERKIMLSEEKIETECKRAVELAKKGLKQQSLKCLREKKTVEGWLQGFVNMKSMLQKQLDVISSGEVIGTVVSQLQRLNNTLKLPRLEEVDALMDTLQEQNEAVSEVTDALTMPAQITDEELERELEELLASDDEPVDEKTGNSREHRSLNAGLK